MLRELLIFRHGKAYADDTVDDFQRPLKDGGKRSAQRMGVWLAAMDLLPDHVLASGAERAKVTAEKASKAMGLTGGHVNTDQRIYDAGLEDLLLVLADTPESAKRVLLVGHNPGLEQLLAYLADQPIDSPEGNRLLPTAGLARLQMPQHWHSLKPGCGQLLDLIRPCGLPKLFPFPSPHGSEGRKRPAYYYSQSSVIPYRVTDGRVEVLIIASSKSKHAVIPKGIQDPGLSPQDSAAKEAEEEAGVEGHVAEQPIGSYSYDKWGATCTVTVYPMRVTRIIPEQDWEERHRGRQWMSPEQAADQLRQRELGPIVLELAGQVSSGKLD